MTTIGARLVYQLQGWFLYDDRTSAADCTQQGGLVVNKMRSQSNPWMQRR
jgi:hypothetical protein